MEQKILIIFEICFVAAKTCLGQKGKKQEAGSTNDMFGTKWKETRNWKYEWMS